MEKLYKIITTIGMILVLISFVLVGLIGFVDPFGFLSQLIGFFIIFVLSIGLGMIFIPLLWGKY